MVVQDHLSALPLACLRCNGEVSLERFAVPLALVESLAAWRSVHRSLYLLWLDSGAYEGWARACLEDPRGAVHVQGLELTARLNEVRRAYYWWFQDRCKQGFVPPARCPRCDGPLTTDEGKPICAPCAIVLPESA